MKQEAIQGTRGLLPINDRARTEYYSGWSSRARSFGKCLARCHRDFNESYLRIETGHRITERDKTRRWRENARHASLDISHGEVIRRRASKKKPREIDRKIRYRPDPNDLSTRLSSRLKSYFLNPVRRNQESKQSVDAVLMICGVRLADSNDRETCVH